MTASTFTPGELAVVCARYDIGDVVRADPLGGGSTGSPKVVLTLADDRRLVLKRRGPGHNDPELVRFTHEIQASLASHAYPVAPLLPTRDAETMLTIGEHIYELFEFVEGTAYDRSIEATHDAGRGLAFFHLILAKHIPAHRTTRASYHDAAPVREALDQIAQREEDGRSLADHYADGARRADRLGVRDWPTQIIHADWHPGNMRFRSGKVAAVLDYDSARIGPRTIDAAYGALQFSITVRGGGPEHWPEETDLRRLGAFLQGYESVRHAVVSRAEIDAMPWLMIEALIAEAAIPIARHGRFGSYEPGPFLRAILGKVRWIASHRQEIRACLNA